MKSRIEEDPLGGKRVPADVYYGIQTLRALENFPISGLRAHPIFVKATVMVKRAAAEANSSLGLLDPRIGRAIIQAADEVLKGNLADQFVVDVYQAGAGTSHNMNVNEVLANRAIEILVGAKGDYSVVHPNDDVNMAQSTNDVFPTAMRLATLLLLEELYQSLSKLEEVLSEKGREFDGIIKAGRTHLQDAAPVRLGQEFMAYARAISSCARTIREASRELLLLGIGGSAVGTGLNTHPDYRRRVVENLRKLTGLKLRSAPDLFEAMQSMAPFASLSGALRALALELIRIANDLRLMSSGPRTGLGEITLPPVQPGSSIMPGKVNPVMAEALNMVGFQVVGNDLTISLAAQAGQLELNVMMPVIIHNLLQSMDILKNGIRVFAERCVAGITANRERCRELAELSVALATALNPYIGYGAAAEIAEESVRTGRPIREVILDRGIMSKEKLERVLYLMDMTRPQLKGKVKWSRRVPR